MYPTQENIMLLLKVIIMLVVLCLIIKYFFKIALTIIAILIIFQIGFMLTGDNLNERFLLSKYLDEGTNTKTISFFNNFRQRGNEIAVINQEKVYDSMLDGVEKGTEVAIEQVKKIDIGTFAKGLAKRIYTDGIEVNREELKKTIYSNMPDLKDEEIDLILNKVEEYKETGK